MFLRKPYSPPFLVRHDSNSPEWARLIRSSRDEEQDSPSYSDIAGQDCVTVVDLDRRYVHVSDEFCKLLDYDRKELIGRRYDELTAPGTNDIPTVFNLFCQVEYMHGLWMLVARSGARILVRYESWLRPDGLIEGHMQQIWAGR